MPFEEIRNCPLFEGLEEEELRELAERFSRRSFKKGEVVVRADEAGDTFCLIVEGRAKVQTVSINGKEIILSTLGPGEFFGEMAILEGEPRSASVVAAEPLELLMLAKEDFLELLEQSFSVSRALLTALSSRLRRASGRIESLATLDVFGRLARFLIDSAERDGVEQDDGFIAIERPTHQDIASTIGTSRETVSRLMHDLIDRGVATEEGRTIYLRRGSLEDLSLQS